MSTIAPPYAPPWPGVPGVDPLAGGSLSIGRTGLPSLAGQLRPLPSLPYASPLTYQAGGGLASQVPVGVGRNAATAALNLGPQLPTSGGGGIGSRLAGSLGGLKGSLTKPTMLKGLGWGLAGGVGSGLVDKLNLGGEDSALDQTLTYGTLGAGFGAPFGPIGALGGGVVGSGYGLLKSVFGGGGDDEKEEQPVAVLANAIQTAGLDPATTEQILNVYDTKIALAQGLPEERRDAAIQSAFDQTSQMILQAAMTKQETMGAVPGQVANTLALQQQAQAIFEPLARDIETTGNLYAQAMSGIRDNLPESYRAISDATVAREITSADRLANAYRAQAALTPVAQRLTQYQADQQQYASQLFSQMLAQNAAGVTGGGGGGADLNALLQATG